MDEQQRQELLGKLEVATARRAELQSRLEAYGKDIEAVRRSLGNPFFYGGRPDDDPKSEAHFTGARSFEPALVIWREWQAVSREVETLTQTLHA